MLSREAQPSAGNFGIGISDFGFTNVTDSFMANPKSQIRNPKSTSPDIALGCASRLNGEQVAAGYGFRDSASKIPLSEIDGS
jgi:hypothetical protein